MESRSANPDLSPAVTISVTGAVRKWIQSKLILCSSVPLYVNLWHVTFNPPTVECRNALHNINPLEFRRNYNATSNNTGR